MSKHVISDELIWQILDKQFCSYKRTGIDQDMCSHPLNVYQVCKRIFCPLSNSRYATIIEKKGKIYLLLKSPEKTHLPNQQWDKILLSENYEQGLKDIDALLQFWDHRVRRRCKIRFTKIKLYLRRMRRLRMSIRPGLTHFKKRQERRLDSREERALNVAKVENRIQEELLNRLRTGVYGTIYDQQRGKLLEKEERRKRKNNINQDLSDDNEEEEEDQVEEEEEEEFFADYQLQGEKELELDDIGDIEDIIKEYEGNNTSSKRSRQRISSMKNNHQTPSVASSIIDFENNDDISGNNNKQLRKKKQKIIK